MFPVEDAPGGNAAAHALPGKHADFDFRLVQPAPMLDRLMNRGAVPEIATCLLSKMLGE